jgi:hypothetical protein
MSQYIPGSVSQLELVELRVISTLLQQQAPNSQQDELRVLRTDTAFDLTNPPPPSASSTGS